MNIEQRIRSIIWPVTVFLFINTIAIILFVYFGFAELDNESIVVTSVFRICILLFSLFCALKLYAHIKKKAAHEHEHHAKLRAHAHRSITQKVIVIADNVALGLLQVVFILVSGLSFWSIINFSKENPTQLQAYVFFVGCGVIILSAAFVLTRRLALAVLVVTK